MILTRKGESRPAPESRAHVRMEPVYGRGLAGLAAHSSLDAEG